MEFTIVMFDLDNLVSIREFSYPTAAYVHQGWFSEDHRFLYTTDEFDEQVSSSLFGFWLGDVDGHMFMLCIIFQSLTIKSNPFLAFLLS